MSAAQMLQQPTLPGKVDGIIGLDPCVLQCRECGEVATQDRRSLATFIILSGFKFHRCGPRDPAPRRLCPSCLTAAQSSCERCGGWR